MEAIMKQFAILLFAVFVLLVSTSMTNAAFVRNPTNGHYYDFISAPNNFWQAQNIAKTNYGAHLVTISDASENQWLVDTFNHYPAWIGFTDEVQEGSWHWITGEPVTYTKWYVTEPNNGAGLRQEDYAFTNYGLAGSWADVGNGDSRYPYYAIIERESAVPIPGAAWLFISGLVGVVAARKRFKKE